MKYTKFFWFFCLSVLFLVFCESSHASGISNEYGEFFTTKTAREYAVTFTVRSASKKFPKIKEVTMIDYGDDGEGDISVVLHGNGDREVFFRNEDAYRRYILKNARANVCGGVWWWFSPRKNVYRKNQDTWECLEISVLFRGMWSEIDDGFAEAKKGEWDALSERILENMKKIKK